MRFVNQDGTVLQEDELDYGIVPEYRGETPTRPATDTFSYTFAGWDKKITAVEGDSTYTATYEATPIPPAPKKATLTFDLGGGSIDGKTSLTIEADVGDVITIPKAPVRDGYTFKYWKGSEYHPGDKYTVEGDHTFTAVWEKNTDDDGGSSDNGGNAAKGSSPNTGDTLGGAVAALAIAAVCVLCIAVIAMFRCRQR